MSVVLDVTVKCDRGGCSTTFVDQGWPNDVRARARKAGWTSDPDLCPAHPPGSEDPAPTLFDHLPTGDPT